MNSKFGPVMLLAFAFSLHSCQRPLIVDDESSSNDAVWKVVDYKSNAYIQELYATPFELYVFTENTFARLDANLEIIEKRELPFSSNLPSASDNTFVRLTTNAQNRQVIEFNLARSASEIFKVLTDTLPAPPGNSLDIERQASKIGAFSADGTLFLMAARVLPARYYSLYLFNVQQNVQHNSFVSVKMVKRIDLSDVEANVDGVIRSITFEGGNFYVATEQGAWRITPAGVATKQFEQWKEDCFSWLGDLYMTGTVPFDLDKSIDNGLTWERVNVASDLRHVAVADTTIFTQEVLGKYFSVMPKDFKKAKQIAYPSAAKLDASLFYGLAFFNGRYYFGIDKDVYAVDKIKTK